MADGRHVLTDETFDEEVGGVRRAADRRLLGRVVWPVPDGRARARADRQPRTPARSALAKLNVDDEPGVARASRS